MTMNLEAIAMQLSVSEIKELLRIKKSEGKKINELRQKRNKLAADLAKLDAQLAGDDTDVPVRKPRRAPKAKAAAPAAAPKRGGRKPGPAAAAKAAPAAKPGKRGGARMRGGKVNMAEAVRNSFEIAGTPLRAREVVDLLPQAGVKVANELEMRKRVSVILAQHKKSFEQIERGIYRLKQD